MLQGGNGKRFTLLTILAIIGAIANAYQAYRTAQLQANLNVAHRRLANLEASTNSLFVSSSASGASISSICEKVLFTSKIV